MAKLTYKRRVITMNFNQPECRLAPFEAQVREYFDKTPPATIAQACAEIGKITGIYIRNTQMRYYTARGHKLRF